jgi:hypothetical protein
MQCAHALENLPGYLNAVAFAFNSNLTMPCQDFDPEGIANLPQVLVSTTENRQFLGMSIQTDRDFRHASPRADPGEPKPSATQIVAQGPRLIEPQNSYYYAIE